MKVPEIIAMLSAIPPDASVDITLRFVVNGSQSRQRPMTAAERQRAYRLRNRGRLKRWSTENYALVFERDGDACRYCGSAEELTVDHVLPRSRGGGDEPGNLVVACKGCNSRKKDRTPEEAGMVLR